MPRVVCLRGERHYQRLQWSQYFLVEDHVNDAEATIRKAIDDYLKTQQGQSLVDYASGEPNWGDVNSSTALSAEWLKPYGITPALDVEEIEVNHDEVLYQAPDDDES